jgi:hypothetical protein
MTSCKHHFVAVQLLDLDGAYQPSSYNLRTAGFQADIHIQRISLDLPRVAVVASLSHNSPIRKGRTPSVLTRNYAYSSPLAKR